MVMPNAYPVLSLAPQTASHIASIGPNVLQGYYLGREERLDDERRNYLREAGGMAAQGNISGAVGAAFRGGDPSTAINISNWDTGRRKQALDMLLDGARRADTPERWQALVGSVERVFGPDMVANYRDFNSRPTAMTALEQAQLRLAQSHADLYEAQAGAAGRQAENRRAFLNLLTGQPPSDAASPPPLPTPPVPVAPSQPAPAVPVTAPRPPMMQRSGIGSDAVAAPPVASTPGGVLQPGAAPALTPPAPQAMPAPQPQPAPAAPQAAAPAPAAPPSPAQPQERRTVAQIFQSASPTEQAEVLALIQQNKTDDAMKRLREIAAGGNVPDAIRTQAIRVDQAYSNITSALDGYRTLVENEGIVAAPGEARDAVVQARRNIQLQLKELFNLGVLNGPDLELMDQMLPDPAISISGSGPLGLLPSGLGNFYANPAGRVGPAVERLKEILRGIRNSQATTIGLPPIPPPPQGAEAPPQQGTQPQRQSTPPDGSRRTLNGVNYVVRNGQWFQE